MPLAIPLAWLLRHNLAMQVKVASGVQPMRELERDKASLAFEMSGSCTGNIGTSFSACAFCGYPFGDGATLGHCCVLSCTRCSNYHSDGLAESSSAVGLAH